MKKSLRTLLNYSIAVIVSLCCVCLVLTIAVNSSGSIPSAPAPIQIFDTPLPIPTIIALTYSAARTQTAIVNPAPLSTAILVPSLENISTSIGTSTFTPTVTMLPTYTFSVSKLQTINALTTYYANPTSTMTPFIFPTDDGTLDDSSSGGVCLCSSDSYACKDFSTHKAAQACFDYCVSQGRGDIHRLDGNNDGNACESLP